MTAIDTDVKSVQRMFDVNVFGPMRMVHHFHDMLIQASGTIINISSIGAIVPYVYGCKFTIQSFRTTNHNLTSIQASYNATKAALAHWANTVRVEMAPLGVKVLVVYRSYLQTLQCCR
jgi:1-acylglycerone phosphate reductase